MTRFTLAEFEACLKLWKCTLEFEAASTHRIYPVKKNIADIEGKAYFKVNLAKNSLLQAFLVQQEERFEIDINEDILSFLTWLSQQKEIALRYQNQFDLNLYAGFPTFYYTHAGKTQLGCLFYTEINAVAFHSQAYFEQLANHAIDRLELQHYDQFADEVNFHIYSQIIEEQLGFDDALLIKIIKKIKKAQSNEQLLKLFLSAIDENKTKDNIPLEALFQRLYETLQTAILRSDAQHAIQIFPHALFFSCNDANPLAQIQKDYDDLLEEEITATKAIPKPLHSFLFEHKASLLDKNHLITRLDQIEFTDQQAARLQDLLNNDYAVVNGPPGTGKTFIITNLIANKLADYAYQIACKKNENILPIVVTSTNNQAVDNAMQKLELLPHLPCAIRMGSYIKLNEITEKTLYEYIQALLQVDEKQALEEYDKTLNLFKKYYETCKKEQKLSHHLYEQARLIMHLWVIKNKQEVLDLISAILYDLRKRKRLITLKKKENLNLFFRVFPIIGTTLLSIRNLFSMQRGLIDLLLLDESSQCEPSYVIPALFRSKQAILIGDICQLEPINSLKWRDLKILAKNKHITITESALKKYFNTTDYPISAQHIAIENTDKVYELKEHFRCHRSIISICDELCDYGLTIKSEKNNPKAPLFGATSLWYYQSEFLEQNYSSSWYNKQEAELILDIVELLKNNGYQDSQIAILTPYRGQFNFIIKLLIARNYRYQNGHFQQEKTNQHILVGTVHRLQGGERDIILFSSVLKKRDAIFINSKLNIINVAVSRAKKYFIFVGDLENIKYGIYSQVLYKHLIQYGQRLII